MAGLIILFWVILLLLPIGALARLAIFYARRQRGGDSQHWISIVHDVMVMVVLPLFVIINELPFHAFGVMTDLWQWGLAVTLVMVVGAYFTFVFSSKLLPPTAEFIGNLLLGAGVAYSLFQLWYLTTDNWLFGGLVWGLGYMSVGVLCGLMLHRRARLLEQRYPGTAHAQAEYSNILDYEPNEEEAGKPYLVNPRGLTRLLTVPFPQRSFLFTLLGGGLLAFGYYLLTFIERL